MRTRSVGRLLRARRRRVTGKLFGYAQWGPWRRLADRASEADAIASAERLAQEALRFGVTSLQIFTLMPTERYVRALERAKLAIRVRVIRFPPTRAGARDLAEGRALPRRSPAHARVAVTGTKWLLDGTPLERRAALRTSYRDRPGWSGDFYLPE